MKTLYFATFLLILAIGAGIYLSPAYKTPVNQVPSVTTASPSGTVATLSTSTAPASLPPSPKPAPTPVPVSTPKTNPTPTPATPGAPVSLTVDVASPTQTNLSWQPPTQGGTVLGYAVYRNFSQIGLTPDTVFSDVNYSSEYSYSYNVTAYDKNGLQSAYSQTFTIEGSAGAPPASSSTSNPPPSPIPVPTPTPVPMPTPSSVPTPTQTPAPNQTPAPSSGSGCGSGGSCTASQIAAHNTRSDCWVYLSQINKAYNITAYVQDPGQHPGGDVIVSHCGTDIYNYFLGNAGGHKHSNNALNNILQSYYIGPVQ